jgi:hypothetical protein
MQENKQNRGAKMKNTIKKNPNGGEGRRKQKKGFSPNGNQICLCLWNFFFNIIKINS